MQPPPPRPLARSASAGSAYSRPPQTPNQQHSIPRGQQPNAAQAHPGSNAGQRGPQQNRPPPPQPQPQQSATNANTSTNRNMPSRNTPPYPLGQSGTPGQQAAGSSETTGFFSARAVNQLPEESLNSGQILPQTGQIFNPRAESPSIRKTPGIDHNKSKPVARNGQHVPPPSSQSAGRSTSVGSASAALGTSAQGASAVTATTVGAAGHTGSGTGRASPAPPQVGAGRGNIINPHLDQTRRIGAPGGNGSPLANRGQYRPPTMINKRQHPNDGPGTGAARPALVEVSNNTGSAPAVGSGPDVKRQKMS